MISFSIDELTGNEENIISDLTYSCYAFNRDEGMSAEAALRLWPQTGEAMNKKYNESVLND